MSIYKKLNQEANGSNGREEMSLKQKLVRLKKILLIHTLKINMLQ